MSYLAKTKSLKRENKTLLESDYLVGEVILPNQFFNIYYMRGQREKEEALISMSKYRLFIKTVSYGDTIKIPFMMIDQLKISREMDILTLVCKDARTISLCRNPTYAINKSDEFKVFIDKLREFIDPRSIKDSFAYDYKLAFDYPDDGWNVFDPLKYYSKLIENWVVDGKPVWCISEVNRNYKISPTYPSCIVVPTAASDEEMLKRVSVFRSKGRIPSLCWKHPTEPITITRCSQPKIGLSFNSSTEDKQLIEAIRQSNPLSSTLYLVDARPKVSAIGNVIGPTQGGYEHDYKNTEMRFWSNTYQYSHIHKFHQFSKKIGY